VIIADILRKKTAFPHEKGIAITPDMCDVMVIGRWWPPHRILQ
jgi:hypothetical protein